MCKDRHGSVSVWSLMGCGIRVCGVYVWVYAWEGSRVLYVSVFPLPYHKPVTTHITQAVLQHTSL